MLHHVGEQDNLLHIKKVIQEKAIGNHKSKHARLDSPKSHDYDATNFEVKEKLHPIKINE